MSFRPASRHVSERLTGKALAFAEPDLAAAVGMMLAERGYVATRLVPAPNDAQPVGTQGDATVVVELLAAELRLYRTQAEQAAGEN